ncbi:MAG: HAD-IA family hydrolase [Myxococcales bacterium]
MTPISAPLLEHVELLCLDAGNTILFLDHARVAAVLTSAGLCANATSVERAEGQTKRLYEDGSLLNPTWCEQNTPGAVSWARLHATLMHCAGCPVPRLPELLDALWTEHRKRNLYHLVPQGLANALLRLRTRGVQVAVVSNSEGTLEELLDSLGLVFDTVIDSGRVGVEKPEPRIFELALERTHTTADHALHLGDSFPADIVGARLAHLRAALIDPFGHLAGRHPDVPRVPGVVEVAEQLGHAKPTPS